MQGPTNMNKDLKIYFCSDLVKLSTADATTIMHGNGATELQLHIKMGVFASRLLLRLLVQVLKCSKRTSPQAFPVAF